MSSPLSSTHHTRPASTNHLLTALNLLILCISCLSPLLCLSLSLPLLQFFLFPLYHGDSLRCLSGKAALFLRHHHHHHRHCHHRLCERGCCIMDDSRSKQWASVPTSFFIRLVRFFCRQSLGIEATGSRLDTAAAAAAAAVHCIHWHSSSLLCLLLQHITTT